MITARARAGWGRAGSRRTSSGRPREYSHNDIASTPAARGSSRASSASPVTSVLKTGRALARTFDQIRAAEHRQGLTLPDDLPPVGGQARN